MAKKILIIEDDANILYSLQAKFRVEGFEVEIDSGDSDNSKMEIMNKVRNFRPDIVVTDLILPKINGFDIVKEIKSSPGTHDTLVFVFSNLSDTDSKERGLALGVDFYAIKNKLSVDDFIDSVKAIIRNKKI